MICAVCYGVLRGHQGSQWRGTFDLHFDHQVNRMELRRSADMKCAICRSILVELSRVEEKSRRNIMSALGETFLRFLSGEVLQHQIYLDEARSPLISAYLSEIYDQKKPKVYRLDFKTRNSDRVGTFVLQQTGDRDNVLLHTPFSSNTESDEVLEVAKGWINDCINNHPECRGPEPKDRLLPSRLIDLGAVAKSGLPEHRVNPEQVRLVVTAEEPPKAGDVYVTLSHCWGKAQFLKLEEQRVDEFRKGIKVESLPKTFQNAIKFARRLGQKVRYIWIDSLCIIQGRSKAQREDWLTESAKMHEIYRNTYCNISATAAADSEQGLFADREPRELWEDEINLNVDGIPGQKTSHKHPIKRCSILDLSFWERNVDDAPVNRRAWVLQERLMAPRVLHFCQGQIAWECGRLDAAESFRDGLPPYRLTGDDVIRGGRLKGLPEKNVNGQNLLLAAYQRWKRVVEVYSKTNLTNGEDKLIALSGIAKMMSAQVGETYVAGLWRGYISSQLLWSIEPVFDNGVFSYPSKRAKDYRAPSFSWAAIDAPQGVSYGDITEDGLLIDVVKDEVRTPQGTHDKFGLVLSAELEVSGVLKKIEIKQILKKEKSIRFIWNLKTRTSAPIEAWFSNVFLDSPLSDLDIFGPRAEVFCLPARVDGKNYLTCLLLQLEKKGKNWTQKYKRIGITKIPPYTASGQQDVLAESGDENTVPCALWDVRTKRHTFRIV